MGSASAAEFLARRAAIVTKTTGMAASERYNATDESGGDRAMNKTKCPDCGNLVEIVSSQDACPHCTNPDPLETRTNNVVGVSENLQVAAQRLAEQHYRLQPEISGILAFPGQGASIRLLEINDSLPASGMAMPLGFKAMPASGIPYPSVIVSVTSGEFDQIKKKQMQLPPGWNLDNSLSFPRPNDIE
jgi:hypothetical protein